MEYLLSFAKISAYMRIYLDTNSFYNLYHLNTWTKSMISKSNNNNLYWKFYAEILMDDKRYVSKKELKNIIKAISNSGCVKTFRKLLDLSNIWKYYAANKGIKIVTKNSDFELIKLVYLDHPIKYELDTVHIKKAFQNLILSTKRSANIIELFLHDTRININDRGNAIIMASEVGDSNIVCLLLGDLKLKNIPKSELDYWVNKAFINSANRGHLGVIKLLTELTDIIEIDTMNIINTYQSAFLNDKFEVVNYLFSRVKTPLLQSVIENFLTTAPLYKCDNKWTIFDILNNTKLDPSRNNNKYIHDAVYYNNIVLATELLKDNRVLKKLDEKPICIASRYGYIEIIKILLDIPNNNWTEYAIVASLNNGYFQTSLFLFDKVKNFKKVIDLATSTYNQGIQDMEQNSIYSNPLGLTRNLHNYEIEKRTKILSLINDKII
jgi:hypothetical protein